MQYLEAFLSSPCSWFFVAGQEHVMQGTQGIHKLDCQALIRLGENGNS
jgi:hypothetical protein